MMVTLTPDECRVLGVLIEKAQTTPAQYPLSLNALVAGCNQRNNRDPVVEWDEDRVFRAVDALRQKGLVKEAMLSGTRVSKFRHVAREVLAVTTPELVILAELLLRGPQSAGEIRGRASRMAPLESMESVELALRGLAARPEAMTRELAPLPGQRAHRWAQLLCPTLHPLDHAGLPDAIAGADPAAVPAASGLAERVERLEREVADLRRALAQLVPSGPSRTA